MDKKINFTEQELSDLKIVLKTVEPEIGIGPDLLYRTYDIIFRKSYETKLEFTSGYIDSDKCYVKIGVTEITAREITNELIDLNLLYKFRHQHTNENGDPVFHDTDKRMPVRRTLYKTMY
jgi:hypothetical protein